MALVKGVSEGVGMQSAAQDLNHTLGLEVATDAAAALAITQRWGAGKLRHVNVGHLWIQEKVHEKSLSVRKVRGIVNPADALTKYCRAEVLDHMAATIGLDFREGYAEAGIASTTRKLGRPRDNRHEEEAIKDPSARPEQRGRGRPVRALLPGAEPPQWPYA